MPSQALVNHRETDLANLVRRRDLARRTSGGRVAGEILSLTQERVEPQVARSERNRPLQRGNRVAIPTRRKQGYPYHPIHVEIQWVERDGATPGAYRCVGAAHLRRVTAVGTQNARVTRSKRQSGLEFFVGPDKFQKAVSESPGESQVRFRQI